MTKNLSLLKPIEAPRGLTAELVARLTADITSGKLPPGSRLPTEQEMIAATGVSRTVIREAVAALRADKLVVTRQGVGAFVAEQVRRHGGELGQVDADQVLPEVPGQVPGQQGLVQRAEPEVVPGVHQVDRVAHQVSAKHGPFGNKLLQLLMTEAGQPRPQPDVRGQRGLGLQAGQMTDRLQGGQRGPVEQELAGKPRPDTFRYAAQQLGVDPAACVVLEDALSGVRAGAAGGFARVIGVDRGVGEQALLDAGADEVVSDLAELVP